MTGRAYGRLLMTYHLPVLGPRRRRVLLAVGAAALALTAFGCGSSSSSSTSASGNGAQTTTSPSPSKPEVSPAGDIPDNQAYVPFTPSGGGFSVKVPEGWSRTAAGTATMFTDKLNTIRVETAPAQAPLTIRDARQTELPKLASSVKGYQAGQVSGVTRSAGPAIRMTYLAAAPANPVTGKTGTNAVERYVFFHKGKDIILTLSGPKGADNVDPWRIVTDSVRWTA
jgi:hypothetical protein